MKFIIHVFILVPFRSLVRSILWKKNSKSEETSLKLENLRQWVKAGFDAKDSRISGNPKRHVWIKKTLHWVLMPKATVLTKFWVLKNLERKEKVNKKVEKFYTQEKIYHWNKQMNNIVCKNKIAFNIKWKKLLEPNARRTFRLMRKIWTGLRSYVDKTWRHRCMFVY